MPPGILDSDDEHYLEESMLVGSHSDSSGVTAPMCFYRHECRKQCVFVSLYLCVFVCVFLWLNSGGKQGSKKVQFEQSTILSFFLFILAENRFYSHIIHPPNQFPLPPLLLAAPHILPSPTYPFSLCFLVRNEQALGDDSQTVQNKIPQVPQDKAKAPISRLEKATQ